MHKAKTEAPTSSYKIPITAISHLNILSGLFTTVAGASLLGLIPSMSRSLTRISGAPSPLLKKAVFAGWLVAAALVLLSVVVFIVTELLLNGGASRRRTSVVMEIYMHLGRIEGAQMGLFFIAAVGLVPVAMFGRELAGLGAQRTGGFAVGAAGCLFVAGLFRLILFLVRKGDRGRPKVIPIWVDGIMYLIFHEGMKLSALVLAATGVGMEVAPGPVGKGELLRMSSGTEP